MNSTTNTQTNLNIGNDQNRLLAFLKSYGEHIGNHKSEIEFSCEMVESGTSTQLSRQIEDILLNPIKAVVGVKHLADEQLSSIAEGMCRLFMLAAKQKDLVDSVFRTKKTPNELVYCVVLKTDTFESRDSVFSFLDFYTSLDVSEHIAINFQFMPAHFIDRIKGKEIIA